MLMAAGYDPLADRTQFLKNDKDEKQIHNALFDAEMIMEIWFKLNLKCSIHFE